MEFAERCHVGLCVFFCYVVVSRDQCVVGHRKGDADASSEKTAMDEEAVRFLFFSFLRQLVCVLGYHLCLFCRSPFRADVQALSSTMNLFMIRLRT